MGGRNNAWCRKYYRTYGYFGARTQNIRIGSTHGTIGGGKLGVQYTGFYPIVYPLVRSEFETDRVGTGIFLGGVNAPSGRGIE